MRNLVLLCGLSVLLLTLTSCTSQECQLHQGIKDARFEVKKIENGAIVKITSDNPRRVAEIQKHCEQVVAPRTANVLPCGKCPGSKKCWDKKEVKTE
jgi:hypothetical protein